jgi:hypothetical protein
VPRIKVAKIATGEIEEDTDEPQCAAAELGRKGGKARAERMTPAQRVEAAAAAAKRWNSRCLHFPDSIAVDRAFSHGILQRDVPSVQLALAVR